MLRALAIPADGSPTMVEVEDNLESYQAAVDGMIEAVYLTRDNEDTACMYLNEEGKITGLPINAMASKAAWRGAAIPINDYIAGDVIVLRAFGTEPMDGENGPCPDWVFELVGLAIPEGATHG